MTAVATGTARSQGACRHTLPTHVSGCLRARRGHWIGATAYGKVICSLLNLRTAYISVRVATIATRGRRGHLFGVPSSTAERRIRVVVRVATERTYWRSHGVAHKIARRTGCAVCYALKHIERDGDRLEARLRLGCTIMHSLGLDPSLACFGVCAIA